MAEQLTSEGHQSNDWPVFKAMEEEKGADLKLFDPHLPDLIPIEH